MHSSVGELESLELPERLRGDQGCSQPKGAPGCMTKGSISHAAGGVVVTLSRVQPNAASAFQKVLLQGHLTK